MLLTLTIDVLLYRYRIIQIHNIETILYSLKLDNKFYAVLLNVTKNKKESSKIVKRTLIYTLLNYDL